MAGVERGPSPPLLSGVPLSAPPWYLAIPVGVAQSSLPVAASSARQTSAGPLSVLRATTVKTLPSPATNELSPAGVGTRHKHLGAAPGQSVWIVSGETPPVSAPRYWLQSAAIPGAPPARHAQPATRTLHQGCAPRKSAARSQSNVGKRKWFISRESLHQHPPASKPGIAQPGIAQ